MSKFQSTRPMRGATLKLLDEGKIFIHFNPRAPCGARLFSSCSPPFVNLFQSTRPMRGATGYVEFINGLSENFNPRAPCGARHAKLLRELRESFLFQSTRPMRGATGSFQAQDRAWLGFQSTRPMRGATLLLLLVGALLLCISIHAPHAGRDWGLPNCTCYAWDFNPRAPCGARPHSFRALLAPALFQSTRPMRGATRKLTAGPGPLIDFNPRAPCGARRGADESRCVLMEISIHAPHAGRDLVSSCAANVFHVFQSTRPMRGATEAKDREQDTRLTNISIHAPHAGRDVTRFGRSGTVFSGKFQSTRPMRGATFHAFIHLS